MKWVCSKVCAFFPSFPLLNDLTAYSFPVHVSFWLVALLQIWIIFVRERGVGCVLHLLVVLSKESLIDLYGRGL